MLLISSGHGPALFTTSGSSRNEPRQTSPKLPESAIPTTSRGVAPVPLMLTVSGLIRGAHRPFAFALDSLDCGQRICDVFYLYRLAHLDEMSARIDGRINGDKSGGNGVVKLADRRRSRRSHKSDRWKFRFLDLHENLQLIERERF